MPDALVALVLMSCRPQSPLSILTDAMSTSSAGTNSATEDGTRISETATQFGASPYGESQSSATTSPAKNHRLELDAKVADLANIIEGNTTLGLASSTYFGGASGPEGTYTA